MKLFKESQKQLNSRDYERALQLLDRIVSIDPAFSGAYSERAKINRLQAKPLLALENYKKVIQLNDRDYNAWEGAGRLYEWFGQLEDARFCYSKASELTKTPEGKKELNVLIIKLDKAIKSETDDNFGTIAKTAHQLRRTVSKPAIASISALPLAQTTETILKSSTDTDKTESSDHELTVDNLDHSIQTFRKKVEQKPDDASSHETLAMLYQIKGKYLEAIRHYEDALRLKPNNVDIMIALGDIYSISLNDNKMALYWYAMAIKNETDESKKKSIADRVSKFMAGR